LGIDWREHLRTIDLPNAQARINYAELGPQEDDAEPLALLLVHGLSGAWTNWLENIPHFARRHRVIAPDLPGFGSSPVPDWPITIPACGELLLELCDALGIADCAAVGNSMGGFIAAEATIRQPDRFEKLALVSAAGISSVRLRRQPTEAVARAMAATAPYAFAIQERTFRRPRARAAAFKRVFHRPDLIRPELLWEFFQSGVRGAGFADALANLAGYDFTDRLPDVDVPTLIVWGREDHVVPSPDAIEFGRLLRNSQTVIFGDTGHVPMAERPVRFNRVLETFLAG
jgi:pimeloyl-ACP methyl ester carboxylesterase